MVALDSKEPGISGITGPPDDQRGAGLGLLSRFLGAVFLVLVCGLLLLDHAFRQANHDQTNLDAQAVSLLAESFVTEEANVLARLTVGVEGDSTGHLSLPSEALDSLRHHEELIGAWITDISGRRFVFAKGDTTRITGLARRDWNSSVGIAGEHGRAVAIVLYQHVPLVAGPAGNAYGVGLAIRPEALRQTLDRLSIPSRITLVVQAATDTVAFLGDPESSDQAFDEAKRTIRLPNGGAWSLSSTHALTSRNLRWAVWILGILGVLFLAIGLLREQRRALHAAGRSSELERLYSDVKRANQAKSEFLANVSHELRTPLNAIVGFVELLREGFYGDLSPRQVPPVDRIAASATHLRHLVDQVLDIAKIAAGRLEVHTETIVLRPFVLNIASELESLVSEKGLTFSITVGVSLPRVRTDPSHLRQILINLIGNAVKYTQKGTISIRARLVEGTRTVETSSVNELAPRTPKSAIWIALQVVDTGVGIARKDLDRIFDEFEQVDAGPRGDSMNRGTGLGLAISRRLARLLGGEISVESEPERGSTFTVWLAVNVVDLNRDPVLVPSGEAGTTA